MKEVLAYYSKEPYSAGQIKGIVSEKDKLLFKISHIRTGEMHYVNKDELYYNPNYACLMYDKKEEI